MNDAASPPESRLRRLMRRIWIGWRRFVRGRFDVGMLLKPIVPRSLFGRSLIIIIAPVVLTQAIVTHIFFERHWDQVSKRLARTAAADIALVVESYRDLAQTPDGPDRFADLAARVERTTRLSAAFWPSEALPERSAMSAFSLLDRTLNRELARKLDAPYWFDAHAYPNHVDVRVGVEGGTLRMIVQRNRVFADSGYIFIIWMLGSAVVLLAVAILFLRNQVRPIQRLAEAAESFGKGRDVADFKPSGAREVRRAAIAFLDMKDRIERHIAQRTEMLAGVSHDLRTPLTRLKLELAMFEESAEIADMRRDLEEMERMLEEYLAFAQGQAGESAQDTDVAAFVTEIVQNAARKGQTISVKARDAFTVPLRRNAITRALTNLIENAGKHASRTDVSLRRDADTVRIIVDDDGPGIPEDRWEEAFRPFHRLDEGRNLDSGGVGLGLAVSRDMVRSHGGDVTLDHSPLGGLRAVLWIPV